MLITATQAPVWTAIFSAEDRRNALTRAMVAELGDLIRRLAADDQARVLVLRGAGDVAFCAGADVKEMAGAPAGQPFAPVMPGLYEGILACPKPIVAMLNGDAVGGGLELALCCDIIVAHPGVRVGLPEVRLGTVPRYGAVLLARQAGAHAALVAALLAELRPVADVLGPAAAIVPKPDLEQAAYAIANQLADRSPAAVAAIKLIVRGAGERSLPELTSHPAVLAAIQSDDRGRAMSAFAGPSGAGAR